MSKLEVILVVEDNEQNLELVQYLLEDAGLQVTAAPDAETAREKLEQEVPDLILMDMQLPGTDGLTLVEEIRTQDRVSKVPIIALTAHAMRGDRERFLAGGCDGYIAKPIDATSFVDQVRTIAASAEERS